MKLIDSYDKTRLMESAILAAANAHCPHSGFRVGAAVMDEVGEIIRGCNVENDSYGLTNCAERTALFSTVARGRKPLHIAIACPDANPVTTQHNPGLVMPCGACRQVMSDLLSPEGLIIVVGVGTFTIQELLPLAFKLPPRDVHVDALLTNISVAYATDNYPLSERGLMDFGDS